MSAFFLNHPKETDLALFAGGELGPFARWRIERHVETCKECEQTVADFFHLSDEISPLAEVPDVDWTAMQRNIQAGLAVAAAEPEASRGLPAWTWQLGGAAACAVVAVAVWNVRPEAHVELASAPAAEEAVVNEPVGADKMLAVQSVSAPAEARMEANEQAAARQIAQVAEAEPSLEKKKEAEAPAMLALADRVDERFSTDAAAPPPPAAVASSFAMEADEESLVAEARRTREAFGAGVRAAAPTALTMGFSDSASAKAQPAVYGVTPLPAAGENVQQVGADGWVSVRAFNSDGAMTIIDVYEPQ